MDLEYIYIYIHLAAYNKSFYVGAYFLWALGKMKFEHPFIDPAMQDKGFHARASPPVKIIKQNHVKTICLESQVDPNPSETWIFKICFLGGFRQH